MKRADLPRLGLVRILGSAHIGRRPETAESAAKANHPMNLTNTKQSQFSGGFPGIFWICSALPGRVVSA
jgi:hypothetical protein